MHLPTVLPKQHLAVYGATFFALIIPLYYFSWHYHAAHPWQSAPHRAIRPPSMDFVGDWLNVHLVEPFNPSAISAYCNTTEWRPNLVFRFDNVNGSIADIRGNVVDFLFFALEAGASVLLPDVASQGQKASDAGWDGPAAFHHLFDEDWFLSAMSEACPQMAIYRSSDVETLPEPLSQNYTPKSRRIDIVAGNTRKAYRENIDSWLLRQPGYSPDKSTVINVEVFSSLWEIDTRSLPPSFRRNFPQVLRINAPLRRLAALALQTLATQHPNLSLDPRDPIPPSAFYGVYLEIPPNPPTDAKSHSANANFTSQTDAYISHALSLSLPLLYAASPNTSALAAFREKATTHTPPLTILTKLDLLPEQDLEPLSPSQQVLIDYAILQRCSVFSGFVNSSMVFDVALSRAQRREDEARVGDPWRTAHAVGGMVFDDGVSRVLGRDAWREGRVGRGVWP